MQKEEEVETFGGCDSLLSEQTRIQLGTCNQQTSQTINISHGVTAMGHGVTTIVFVEQNPSYKKFHKGVFPYKQKGGSMTSKFDITSFPFWKDKIYDVQ